MLIPPLLFGQPRLPKSGRHLREEAGVPARVLVQVVEAIVEADPRAGVWQLFPRRPEQLLGRVYEVLHRQRTDVGRTRHLLGKGFQEHNARVREGWHPQSIGGEDVEAVDVAVGEAILGRIFSAGDLGHSALPLFLMIASPWPPRGDAGYSVRPPH